MIAKGSVVSVSSEPEVSRRIRYYLRSRRSRASLLSACAMRPDPAAEACGKVGFAYCSNSEEELLQDANIDAVLIATRHNLHASQALAAMSAGKAVFCEKRCA